MLQRYLQLNRKGISPVISQIILAATVLTIGTGVWYFARGYCSVTSDAYIQDTFELMNVVTERFSVERVYNSSNGSTLMVWINNYGDIDIIIDVYAISSNRNATLLGTEINAGTPEKIDLDFSGNPLVTGEDIQIKIYSRRQNIAYFYYTVH